MKFQTKSRLIYLIRARHRGGHGIHSPSLYRLITTVIEDKRELPDYLALKGLKKTAIQLLRNSSDPSLPELFEKFNLPVTKPRKLYRKVEMPFKFTKVVFRLIRELKPVTVINYGATLGVNLSAAAMAQNQGSLYQVTNAPENRLFCEKLFTNSDPNNIQWINNQAESSVNAEFSMINYPDQPQLTASAIYKSLSSCGENNILIVRGIHSSAEMEAVWHELTASNTVRVSLDLFEIGIVLLSKKLQKENFIYRF